MFGASYTGQVSVTLEPPKKEGNRGLESMIVLLLSGMLAASSPVQQLYGKEKADPIYYSQQQQTY